MSGIIFGWWIYGQYLFHSLYYLSFVKCWKKNINIKILYNVLISKYEQSKIKGGEIIYIISDKWMNSLEKSPSQGWFKEQLRKSSDVRKWNKYIPSTYQIFFTSVPCFAFPGLKCTHSIFTPPSISYSRPTSNVSSNLKNPLIQNWNQYCVHSHTL